MRWYHKRRQRAAIYEEGNTSPRPRLLLLSIRTAGDTPPRQTLIMPSSTSLGLADVDVEVRVAGDRGKREAAAVEAAVEIVGAREEAEDVKTSSTRVQQKSQASVEWAGKIASDAELRQRSLARSAAR